MNPGLYKSICRSVIILIIPGLFLSFSAFSEINGYTEQSGFNTLRAHGPYGQTLNNNTLQEQVSFSQTLKKDSSCQTAKNNTLQEQDSSGLTAKSNTLQEQKLSCQTAKNNTLQEQDPSCQTAKSNTLQEQDSSCQTENKIIVNPVIEKIVILHTNDHHFTANNLTALKDTIVHIRQKYETVFLVSAGDIFVRHPARWIVNGKLMISRNWFGDRALFMINNMNELGYDLMTLGNHEFDYREPYTFAALDAAKFPLLAANIEITTDAIPPLDAWAILNTAAGNSVAFLGLTIASGGKEGVNALDAFETAAGHISLRDSADIFVALTHIGLRRDYQLAEMFPEFDVIVGGHSHDLLEEAEFVNGVLIAQAGGNPHIVLDTHPVYLGKIILTLENGVIVGKKGRIIHVGEKPPEIEEVGEVEAEVEILMDAPF